MLWSNLSYSQIQLKRWYFSPKNIDMTQQVPSIGNIGGASVNVSQVANGAYDKNDPAGAPMFFIADNTVFNKTGNPSCVGFAHHETSTNDCFDGFEIRCFCVT